MDLPVEATVRLDVFPDEAEARRILRSHGFTLTDLSGHQVRVKGSFLDLKAAKASLEPLLSSRTISAVPKASSGAISKRPAGNSSVSGGNRGRNMSPRASPSSANASSPWPSPPHKHPSSPEPRASFSPPPDQRGSFGPGRESFVVDVDVWRYAEQLRKKDIEGIQVSHNVKMEVCEVGETCNITLLGKSARTAAGKLQSLMNDLSKSLRTQEVPLKDMDREGQALLKRIQKERNIYFSVVVYSMNDKLHLIGPSAASYELKQRLLGRPVERTGRTSDKSSRRRSSSLPPISRKNTERDNGAIATPSPVGAAGYSPPKDHDRAAAACFGQGGASRGRSHSAYHRENTRAEITNVPETENKRPSPKPLKNLFKQFKKKIKSIRK
ncbi:RNA-binding protein 43 [Cebidichthys violaceus]|uniref:RNA-binding protein 43 n=1 Tax=Cebidichthys violaceus TaxID=271503 RepID=UPI0035CC6D89